MSGLTVLSRETLTRVPESLSVGSGHSDGFQLVHGISSSTGKCPHVEEVQTLSLGLDLQQGQSQRGNSCN